MATAAGVDERAVITNKAISVEIAESPVTWDKSEAPDFWVWGLRTLKIDWICNPIFRRKEWIGDLTPLAQDSNLSLLFRV